MNDTPPPGFALHAAADNVQIGWVRTQDGFTDPSPPPPLTELRAAKLAALADLRWEKETGGTTFNGLPVATDAVSQTKYIGAVVGAQINPLAVVNWKLSNGTFVTLDAAAITAVAMALRAHVQACFDREAALTAEIEAAETADALAAIDITAGWPA